MPTVTTIEGCAPLGYDNTGHLDEIEELLESLRDRLDDVGDAASCRAKYEQLLLARGLIGLVCVGAASKSLARHRRRRSRFANRR